MKFVIVLGLCFASAWAYPFYDQKHNETGWFVPEIDGNFTWMNAKDFEALKEAEVTSRAASVVDFYLYTNSNPHSPQKLIVGDSKTLKKSNFNKEHPTRIIIHGWQNNYLSEVNVLLRSALLATGKYNVICVDWSSKSETLNYASSVMRVPIIGKKVAGMIDFLHNNGVVSFNKLLVMGHSLGAHVAGFAGKRVKNGRIAQITGLDPAFPLYNIDKPSERLNQHDATYVETIHTCGGMLGFLDPIGKSSFYPNGGKAQPGCGIDLAGICAHSRSYEYYAESIRHNDFPTMKCSNFQAAIDKTCGSTYSSIKMGSPTNHVNAFGNFFVPVNKNPPYGMAGSKV